MSNVHGRDKVQSRFNVADAALDLAVYTENITSNPKVFNQTHQKVIDRITYEATAIYHKIRVANDQNVKKEPRRKEIRARLQAESLDMIEDLKTDIMISKGLFHLSMKRIKHWNKQCNRIRDMVTAWIKSDREEYAKLGL